MGEKRSGEVKWLVQGHNTPRPPDFQVRRPSLLSGCLIQLWQFFSTECTHRLRLSPAAWGLLNPCLRKTEHSRVFISTTSLLPGLISRHLRERCLALALLLTRSLEKHFPEINAPKTSRHKSYVPGNILLIWPNNRATEGPSMPVLSLEKHQAGWKAGQRKGREKRTLCQWQLFPTLTDYNSTPSAATKERKEWGKRRNINTDINMSLGLSW